MHRQMSYYLNVLIGVRYNCSNFCWNGFEYISTELKHFSKDWWDLAKSCYFFAILLSSFSSKISIVNNDTAHKHMLAILENNCVEVIHVSSICHYETGKRDESTPASFWAVSRKPPSGGRLAASGQVNMHMMCLCTEENLTTYDFHIIVKIQCGTV